MGAAATPLQKAQGLQEPLITAENEYNRIVQLLSQPLIPGVSQVPATVAAVTAPATTRFRSGPITQQPMLQTTPVMQTAPVSPEMSMPVRPAQATPRQMVLVQGQPMVVSTIAPAVTYGQAMAAPNGVANAAANALFDRMDANHDGKITRAEFKRAM